jgi:hypothetical protein
MLIGRVGTGNISNTDLAMLKRIKINLQKLGTERILT